MTDKIRRTLLKGIAVAPIALALGHYSSAMAENLSVDDPLAKSLGYTEKSATAGQQCSGCNLWQGGAAARGKCAIFGTKEVNAAGWCKSWVKKA